MAEDTVETLKDSDHIKEEREDRAKDLEILDKAKDELNSLKEEVKD